MKDWDDRMTIIKWINDFVLTSQNQPVLQDLNATAPHVVTNPAPPAISLPGRNSQASHVFGGALNNQPTKGAVDLRNSSMVFTSTAASLPVQAAPQIKQIVKKKVVEVEPEPKHTRSEDNVSSLLELLINANCDYCRYRCRVNSIRFKDTLMFQTRVYE